VSASVVSLVIEEVKDLEVRDETTLVRVTAEMILGVSGAFEDVMGL